MADLRWSAFLLEWLQWSQGNVLAALDAVDEATAGARPARTAPPIAFHAWHLARWADRHAATLPIWLPNRFRSGPADAEGEIWEREQLYEAWGLAGHSLGDALGIGAGMDDDESAALPLPPLAELRRYVRAALGSLEGRVAALDERDMPVVVTDLYGDEETIAGVIGGVISHTDRHLGMIEALRGVLGERGTATI